MPMPTINVEAELPPDKLLEAVKQLSASELEQFVSQVLALQAHRKSPALSEQESDLLMIINSGLPAETQRRYRELIERRRREQLTEVEHKELLTLTDTVEEHQAKRLEALTTLAHGRNIPLRTLMKDLGIEPPAVE